jgi:hypothetical protein
MGAEDVGGLSGEDVATLRAWVVTFGDGAEARVVRERVRPLEEDTLRGRFPGAWAHLQRHRDAQKRRDKGHKDYAAWFAWGRTQGMEAAGPKLLTKTFSRRPAFFRDESDALFCNGYAVSLPSTYAGGLDLRLLQRILNSAVMHYFARLTSFEIEGDYQCY